MRRNRHDRHPVADAATTRGIKPTHHPELEPSSASADDHDDLDHHNPAPVTIEAGITPSPVSRRRTGRKNKKISSQHRDQTPNPITTDPQHYPLPPVKRIFGYFFCNRKKSLASASAAGGEIAFDVEVEVGRKGRPHPARVHSQLQDRHETNKLHP